MKKLFLLLTMLCVCATTALAAPAPVVAPATATTTDTTVVNDKYGFSFTLPAGFKPASANAPFTLGAYTNNKIFLYTKYIIPQSKYTGATFGTATKEEIDEFIKKQRFVTAVNNAKFNYLEYDKHVTAKKFPYVWAMFVATMTVGSEQLKTYLLKNYYYNKDVIIEVDFIIPEDVMKDSVATMNKITDSVEFKVPAQ